MMEIDAVGKVLADWQKLRGCSDAELSLPLKDYVRLQELSGQSSTGTCMRSFETYRQVSTLVMIFYIV